VPPRFRPRPNSPVLPLTTEETSKVLQAAGNARLGVVVGQESIEVGIPTDRKSVLPRHLGILGTTGGGKSTTVSRLVQQLQKAGVATILIDIEGEYTEIDLPTDDPTMLTALELRKLKPEGVTSFGVGHLVGRETGRSSDLKKTRAFSLQFADLSPYVIMETLDLEQPQRDRFLKAYDTTKQLLEDFHIFPRSTEKQKELGVNDLQRVLEVDELEEGYPGMKLEHLLDVVGAFTDWPGITKEGKKRNKGEEGRTCPGRSPFAPRTLPGRKERSSNGSPRPRPRKSRAAGRASLGSSGGSKGCACLTTLSPRPWTTRRCSIRGRSA
jgi:hypothetical protein